MRRVLDFRGRRAFIRGINRYGLAIHGGAGVILRAEMKPEGERAYRAALDEALRSGYATVEGGGSAMDAVVASIRVLEDSPLFNAGYGAVLNADGECEMDAAIMDGRTLAAGSVAALRHIRNPISLARAVLEKSPHVFLVGAGAERFAQEVGFEKVANSEFRTNRRIHELERVKRLEKEKGGGAGVSALQERMIPETEEPTGSAEKWGTVGCVALDREGNLAAGTSTGGITNKKFGRVGDSPIVGAGTFASNATAAVSCTGHGEYFIRSAVAHDLSARMAYGGASLQNAAEAALQGAKDLGGVGGLIAIDRRGCVAMPFNTPGMYRGLRLSDGAPVVELYGA